MVEGNCEEKSVTRPLELLGRVRQSTVIVFLLLSLCIMSGLLHHCCIDLTIWVFYVVAVIYGVSVWTQRDEDI